MVSEEIERGWIKPRKVRQQAKRLAWFIVVPAWLLGYVLAWWFETPDYGWPSDVLAAVAGVGTMVAMRQFGWAAGYDQARNDALLASDRGIR